MKNRHRVSQVVNKLICSRRFGCQLRNVSVGAADRREYRQIGGPVRVRRDRHRFSAG